MNKQFPGTMNYAGILVTDAGAGYAPTNTIVLTQTGGATAAATLIVDTVDGAGAVTSFHFDHTTPANLGIGYSVGDTETDAAAPPSPFTCIITNIDIPNTQEAGCCLYFSPVGAAAANIDVIMEGATYTGATLLNFGYAASDVRTFNLVPVGSFMPVMVKQITSATATNDILALY
jgi:hypothetical protein